MGTADEVMSVSTVVRVADRDRTVEWFREMFDLEPVLLAEDGVDHPIAVYRLAGSQFALWQLPAGATRLREENRRNSFLSLTHPEPAAVHARLAAAGVDVSALSQSQHHAFFYFHDPDGNRYEITSPPKQRYPG